MCRQQETATELVEMKQRCKHLERDNANLYDELSHMRRKLSRCAEIDQLVKQRDDIATDKLLLESQLQNALSTVNQMRTECQVLKSEADLLREQHLQDRDELKRLQEKSQSKSLAFIQNLVQHLILVMANFQAVVLFEYLNCV